MSENGEALQKAEDEQVEKLEAWELVMQQAKKVSAEVADYAAAERLRLSAWQPDREATAGDGPA